MRISLTHTEQNRNPEDLQEYHARALLSALDTNSNIAHEPHKAMATRGATANETCCFSSLELKEERAGRRGGSGKDPGEDSDAS
jgi:hypothetical protein